MNFTEMTHLIDQLTPDERNKLRDYLGQYEPKPPLTGEQKAALLAQSLERYKADLTPELAEQIAKDMNEEYIEPLDDEWTK